MTTQQIGFSHEVPASLEALVIPIDSVSPHPRNVRKGRVDVIAQSIRRFGQQKPIVVQAATPDGEKRMLVIAGNHVLAAAKKLGWQNIAASLVQMDDDEAYQYLLADNKASDLAEYDRQALAAGLQDLADRGKLTETLWSADDLDDLTASLGTMETLYQEFHGDYSDDPERRAERQEREQTRVAPKLREIPIVITAEQHQSFMADIKTLQDAWKTGGVIETILLAVHNAAATVQFKQGEVARVADLQEAAIEAASEPTPKNAPQPPENAPADPSASLPLVSPLRAPSSATGAEETAPAGPPAHHQLDGYDVTEKNELLPEAKDDIWRKAGYSVQRTLKALDKDEVGRSVVIGIFQAVQPQDAVLTVPNAERKRAVVFYRNKFLEKWPTGDMINIDELCALVQEYMPSQGTFKP